jgi:hypothetical protein
MQVVPTQVSVIAWWRASAPREELDHACKRAPCGPSGFIAQRSGLSRAGDTELRAEEPEPESAIPKLMVDLAATLARPAVSLDEDAAVLIDHKATLEVLASITIIDGRDTISDDIHREDGRR